VKITTVISAEIQLNINFSARIKPENRFNAKYTPHQNSVNYHGLIYVDVTFLPHAENGRGVVENTLISY